MVVKQYFWKIGLLFFVVLFGGCRPLTREEGILLMVKTVRDGKIPSVPLQYIDSFKLTKYEGARDRLRFNKHLMEASWQQSLKRKRIEVWNVVFDRKEGSWEPVFLYYIDPEIPYAWKQHEIIND